MINYSSLNWRSLRGGGGRQASWWCPPCSRTHAELEPNIQKWKVFTDVTEKQTSLLSQNQWRRNEGKLILTPPTLNTTVTGTVSLLLVVDHWCNTSSWTLFTALQLFQYFSYFFLCRLFVLIPFYNSTIWEFYMYWLYRRVIVHHIQRYWYAVS